MRLSARLSALGRWLVLGSLAGVLSGAASALFLALLERATRFRMQHEVLVLLLPVAGLAIGFVYERFGQSISGGNNLVIDRIHDHGPEIPLRMAPMVLVGTVLTHLFGGSAGREGTAVQMGAALSDFVSHRLRLGPDERRRLLAAGVAGGFGSVFGTPVAGALFGLEFARVGRIKYEALLPVVVASSVGHMTTTALGVSHVHYPAAAPLAVSPGLLLKWLAFGAAVAVATTCFIELTHWVKRYATRLVPRLPFRMFCGGVLIVVLWKLVGTSDYLGLGVPMIVRAFQDPALPVYVFAAKLVFTALTLGTGFLGGEVTPLFFVGAALGSVLARWLGLPIVLGAGVGLAATFAAASNTPLALSVMAVELFGASVFPHVFIVSAVAYMLVGHRSIYQAQRVREGKAGVVLAHPTPLRDLEGGPEPGAVDGTRQRGDDAARSKDSERSKESERSKDS